jgi:hypothetical protein
MVFVPMILPMKTVEMMALTLFGIRVWRQHKNCGNDHDETKDAKHCAPPHVWIPHSLSTAVDEGQEKGPGR